MTASWLRHPTVHGDTVVFVCEDDLWAVPLAGGRARRLTSGPGSCARPRFSPDGTRLAFDATHEGVRDVYVVDRDGGPALRRTWSGDNAQGVGWRPGTGPGGGDVVFVTAVGQPFAADTFAYTIPAEPAPDAPDVPARLPVGPVAGVAFDGERTVVCRHTADLAWWKRYRGGRMGQLWSSPGPGAPFVALAVDGNVAAPIFAAGRLWFASDRGGDAPQLVSARVEGDALVDLRTHTDHADLAVRFPATDGRTVVYAHGGDLYRLDAGGDAAPERIDVALHSQRAHRQRRFVAAAAHLDDYDIHPDGHSLALTVRGRVFALGHWEGPVRQLGAPQGVRYRHARWLDADHVVVSAAGHPDDPEEALEILAATPGAAVAPRRLGGLDHGRIVALEPAPTGDRIALTDHRHRLYLLDVATGALRELDRSLAGPFAGVSWSADGRWLVWSAPVVGAGARIRLLAVADGDGAAPVDVTDGAYRDVDPSFDPDGEHLYFLSTRTFDPVPDRLVFGYGFPRGMRPYAVTLRRDTPHPFRPAPRPLKGGAPAARGELVVDVDRIADRVVPFPVPEGQYDQIVGVGQGKVLFGRAALKGALDRTWYDPGPPKADLQLVQWDFDKQEATEIGARISGFRPDRRRQHVALRVGARLRIVPSRPDKAQRDDLKRADGAADRRTGWVDLGRVRVSVDPGAEWAQMFDEAWRLMRDHYWEPALAGVDWDAIRERYRALVGRIAARSELSDLLWCMQGELGTSHAYEMGGDYPRPPTWRVGRLGADVAWDPEREGWRVTRVVRGEPGDPERSSPLLAPGAGVNEGDVIVGVHGQPVGPGVPLDAALVHHPDLDVALTIDEGGARREVTVHTLADERPVRYRDWVLRNRALVHAASGGRLGYVHVPDMSPGGFAEFFRDYERECERDGLLVDVRYNRGGHVSQLLLARIARQRLGYKVARWLAPMPYPKGTVAGPLVALANEYAGSDGDIFTHGWKRLGLGPVIGTRTWGGVVGISPRQLLVDRAVTTQPEYASWFDDVGFGLENHGAPPDLEVVVSPDDWAAGRDPQLARAIEVALDRLAAAPPPPRPPMAPPG